jgi:hypothetical protein
MVQLICLFSSSLVELALLATALAGLCSIGQRCGTTVHRAVQHSAKPFTADGLRHVAVCSRAGSSSMSCRGASTAAAQLGTLPLLLQQHKEVDLCNALQP